MIVDAILTVLFAPIRALLEVLPSFTWPSVFEPGGEGCYYDYALSCQAGKIGEAFATLDGWLPMREFVALLPVVVTAWTLYLTVKATRFVVSLVTGGGGAT